MQCLFVYNYIFHPPDNCLLLSLSIYIHTFLDMYYTNTWFCCQHPSQWHGSLITSYSCCTFETTSYTNATCVHLTLHQQWHSGTTLMHVPLTLSLAQLSLVNSWFWPSALLPIYSTPFLPYRMLQSTMDSWFSTSSSLLLPVWSSCFSLPLDASRAALYSVNSLTIQRGLQYNGVRSYW